MPEDQAEEATGASLPKFIKDEFDAFLECGILAHGFLRLRCAGHDKLVASSCAYFNPSWTAFQADRGRHFSAIVDGVQSDRGRCFSVIVDDGGGAQVIF